MRFTFSTFALLACAVTAVNAHFQLAYPPPRGVFNDGNEVDFCGNVARLFSISSSDVRGRQLSKCRE